MASGNQAVGFLQDVVGEHRYRGGTITSYLVELISSLLNQLSTNLIAQGFIVVFGQVYAIGHRDTIVRYGRCTVAFADYHITALGAVGYLNGIV